MAGLSWRRQMLAELEQMFQRLDECGRYQMYFVICRVVVGVGFMYGLCPGSWRM